MPFCLILPYNFLIQMNFLNKDEDEFEAFNLKYLILLVPFALFFLIREVAESSNLYEQNKIWLNEKITSEYKDVVTGKGLDKNNRNNPYLKRAKSSPYFEKEIIWNKIDIGDSLIKIKGDSILKIIKRNKTIYIDFKDIYSKTDSILRVEAKN